MKVQNPLVAAFAEQIGMRYEAARPESFWTCAPLFRHLLDPQFAESVINAALQAIVDDPNHVATADEQTMRLAQGSGWTLSLRLLTRPRRYIHTCPCHALVAPVSGRVLVVDRYELPAGYRNAVFDPAQKLSRAGSLEVLPGEWLELHADGPVHDCRVDAPLMILMLETAPVETLEWRFSKDSLHAWQYADADPQSTDLKTAAWLAGRLAHQTSLKPLKALAAHDNPGVRWAAIQGVGRLSRSEARKLLMLALDDPHPQLRRSAKLALDRSIHELPDGR